MAFADDFGQVSPGVSVGMKVGQVGAGVAFGPIGSMVASVVSLITSLLVGGSAAEKAARTKEGIENVKKVTQDITSRGAVAYQDYDENWVGRQLQLSRPEEVKVAFFTSSIGPVTDSLFNQMGPYLPVLECLAIKAAMRGAGWDERDPEKTTGELSGVMAIMENVRIHLEKKGIDYPNSHEIAADLLAGGSGTTLSSFLAQLKQESEQSIIEQGIQEALRKLGITGTGTQTASLMPDEIFGIPVLYLLGVVGVAYFISRR